MAKTLLQSINEILKRTSDIAGDAGALSSLTDSPRQVIIDLAVQVVNEGIDELYSTSSIAMPNEQAQSTITLVTATRAYALASDLVQLRWPFIDKTNNQYLTEYPGGYAAMLVADPEQDDDGLPHYGAIRPTDGFLHLDRAPNSEDNGKVYTYQYDKNLALTVAASTVPFNDAIFRAMVPVWVQLFKRERKNQFDTELYRLNLGRASALLSQKQARDSYNPRG
jgi:hypothetical protein